MDYYYYIIIQGIEEGNLEQREEAKRQRKRRKIDVTVMDELKVELITRLADQKCLRWRQQFFILGGGGGIHWEGGCKFHS